MTTSWNFQGASFDRSAVGPGAHVDNRGSSGAANDLVELLAALREQLVTAPDGPDRQAAITELDGLDEELAKPGPEPAVVLSRWQRLRGKVETVLPTAAGLAQIASLVNDLAGA